MPTTFDIASWRGGHFLVANNVTNWQCYIKYQPNIIGVKTVPDMLLSKNEDSHYLFTTSIKEAQIIWRTTPTILRQNIIMINQVLFSWEMFNVTTAQDYLAPKCLAHKNNINALFRRWCSVQDQVRKCSFQFRRMPRTCLPLTLGVIRISCCTIYHFRDFRKTFFICNKKPAPWTKLSLHI